MTDLILPAGRADEGRAVAFLSALPKDKAWRVAVTPWTKSRSDRHLRYLNGVCYKILGESLGFERDEISEWMCGAYFGWKDKPVPKTPRNPDGIESVPVRTTTRNEDGKRDVLGRKEFAEYVAFIQRFAAGHGLYIPDPNSEGL